MLRLGRLLGRTTTRRAVSPEIEPCAEFALSASFSLVPRAYLNVPGVPFNRTPFNKSFSIL